MKILIAEKIVLCPPYKRDFKEAMEEIAGEWIDVETNHLFEDQYNVTTPSGKGLRIMQDQVKAVQDDIRVGKSKCQYCYSVTKTGEQCPKGCEEKYLRPFRVEELTHIVNVNRNWDIMYSTQYGHVTPYEHAEFDIMNKKTGEIMKAQKWGGWSTLRISGKVPQSVKSELRRLCNKHNLYYRHIMEDSYVEKTW